MTTLEQACQEHGGTSDFRSGTRAAAVWYHEEAGSVWRMSWQGRSIIASLQKALDVSADGVWGAQTNAALRVRMRQLGLDPSIVRDGWINRAMLEAALAVSYTLGVVGPSATSVAARICVPARAVLPRWMTAPSQDPESEILAVAVDAPASPSEQWRRPSDSELINSAPSEGGMTAVVYRTASGEVRRALLRADGTLAEDSTATAEEVAAATRTAAPGATQAPPQDPGTLAPGATQPPAPTAPPQVHGYGRPPASPGTSTAKTNTAAIVVSAVVGILVVGLVIAATMPQPTPSRSTTPA